MNVSDLMAQPVQRVHTHQGIAEIGTIMLRLGFRHLPVIDEDGGLLGMATDAGVFRHGVYLDRDQAWQAFEPAFDNLTAGDIAEQVEVMAPTDADLARCLRLLSRSKQDALLVVDGGRPVGIVTEHDVVALALEVLPEDLDVDVDGSHPVASVEVSAPAQEALDRMLALGVRHVVVLAGGAVRGVVSMRDMITEDAGRRPELTVGGAMSSSEVYTAPLGTRLKTAAALMKRHKIGCVPILDKVGHPVGIVTRRDVLEAVVTALDSEDLFPATSAL